MPGFKLLTNLEATVCLKLAWREAQAAGYAVASLPEGAKTFVASRGNALLSLLAGPLAPHCRFNVMVETYPEGAELSLDYNKPWATSGMIGVGRVRQAAGALFARIAAAVQAGGGSLLSQADF